MPKGTSKSTTKGSSTKQGIINTPTNLGKVGKCGKGK